jgi:hypothetical protein
MNQDAQDSIAAITKLVSTTINDIDRLSAAVDRHLAAFNRDIGAGAYLRRVKNLALRFRTDIVALDKSLPPSFCKAKLVAVMTRSR